MDVVHGPLLIWGGDRSEGFATHLNPRYYVF